MRRIVADCCRDFGAVQDGTLKIRVSRQQHGDEQVWRTAVEQIVPAGEREDRLLSMKEAQQGLSDDRCYVLLASSDSAAVGLLTAYKFPDLEAGGYLAYLYDIEVLKPYRRKGVGRALLSGLIALCEDEGVKLIWAGTEAANAPARAAFEATEAELEGDSYVEYEWDLED